MVDPAEAVLAMLSAFFTGCIVAGLTEAWLDIRKWRRIKRRNQFIARVLWNG